MRAGYYSGVSLPPPFAETSFTMSPVFGDKSKTKAQMILMEGSTS